MDGPLLGTGYDPQNKKKACNQQTVRTFDDDVFLALPTPTCPSLAAPPAQYLSLGISNNRLTDRHRHVG